MKIFSIKTFFKYFEEIIASSFFLITLTLVIANAIMRYVLRTGLSWSEEFATGCFVWTSFMGAAACYKRRSHIGVNILVNRAPLHIQNCIKIILDFFLLFLCSYMLYISIIYINRSYRKPTAILGISSAVFSISLTFAFFDMAIWSLVFIYRDLMSIKKQCRVISQKGN